MLRDKIEADEATKRRVPELEVRASMHGSQVVFEKQVLVTKGSDIMGRITPWGEGGLHMH